MRERPGPLALVTGPLVFVFALFIVPALVLVAFSLELPSLTFEHYESFFSGPATARALETTFSLALQSSVIAALLGSVLISVIVMRGRRWSIVILAALLMPFIASELVRIVSWLMILGPEGPVAQGLQMIGIDNPTLLGDTAGALIGMVHVELPFFTLAALPSALAVSNSLKRSATSLGANSVQRFMSVTFPLVLPGLVAAWALTFVLGLGYYATPTALGGVREQTTLQALIMNDISQGAAWNHAAALGVLLVTVSLVGFVALAWAGGLRVIYGGARPTVARKRGDGLAELWQRFALSTVWSRFGILDSSAVTAALRTAQLIAAFGIVVYLAAPTLAAVPASLSGGTLLQLVPQSLSVRWYVELFTDDGWASALQASLLVSIPAAIAATAIGLCASIALVRRYAGVGAKYLTLMLLPMIMPIQITAMGLFFVMMQLGIAFTLPSLFLGYTLLGLPYAVIVLSAALQAFDWNVDRAAQSLGANWVRRITDIFGPLLRPALMVSLLFAFVTAFTELVFALFMRTADTTTLAVKLWSAVRYDLDPTTAAAAGLTLLASALAVLIMWIGRLQFARRRRGDETPDSKVDRGYAEVRADTVGSPP